MLMIMIIVVLDIFYFLNNYPPLLKQNKVTIIIITLYLNKIAYLYAINKKHCLK
jgi:hypothetical protein